MSSSNPSLSSHDYACRIWFCPAQEQTERQLAGLSREEREKVWADLSGNEKISKYEINSEDPAFVARKLEQLEVEISNIRDNAVFEQAMRSSPAYVNGRKLRMMFLRADNFDVRAAASRIVRHFDEKLILFGEDSLGRDICLSDLNPEDLECLSCGGHQILQERDHAGRRILFSRFSNMVYRNQENAVSLQSICRYTL
jgi:hypothetical protein